MSTETNKFLCSITLDLEIENNQLSEIIELINQLRDLKILRFEVDFIDSFLN